MRYLFSSFVLLAVGLLAIPARAEGDDKKDVKKDEDSPRVEWREKMIKEFDKDGDGKLSDEERDQAREKMRELHGRLGLGPGRPNGPFGLRGPEGRRGPDGKGPDGKGPDGKGPDGPPKMPKPEELFAKFDKDKDEKLSKEEFKELAEWVHEHMPPPPPPAPPGPPGGRFEGRFEGHIEGRFIEGGPGGPGPRFHGPDGPPPPDGDGPREFRRGGFGGPPPGDGPGPRERRFERRRHPAPDGDRDDDGDGDDDDHGKGEKEGKDKAKDKKVKSA